jgi:hypothetical protein
MLTGVLAPSRFPDNLFAFPFSELGLPHIFSKKISNLWAIAVTVPRKNHPAADFGLAS